MGQFYTDLSSERDPYSLPNAEVFHMSGEDILESDWKDDEGDPMPAGWYWWACFPGCLPDGEAFGPFDSEDEAIADAREGMYDDEY